MNSILIFDFSADSDLSNWYVVDDVVMGGRSSGSFYIGDNGTGVFSGEVSTKNNGGFSSLRFTSQPRSLKDHSKFILSLKGDGKKYQFRVKSKRNDYQSYVLDFKTSGEWQEIEIDFSALVPTFRGRKLDMPNFQSNSFDELGFLIGNKKNESFKLEINKIEIK